MARKKNEKKSETKKDPIPNTNDLPKPTPLKGKDTVITTSDLKKPESIKAAKTYNPGEDQIITSGGDMKPRKWKDVKR